MEREIRNEDGTTRLVAGDWQAPSHRILPERLDEARRWLEARIVPCGEAGVGKALMPLLMTTQMPNTDGMSEETLQAFGVAKMAEYGRLLRDVPADILEAAADACAKASPFFPAVADIFKHANPLIEKRQRQLHRVNELIRRQNAPAEAPAFKPEPEEVRLRAEIARWRRVGADVVMGVNLKRNAIAAEKRLAEIENRVVEAWALEQQTEATVLPPAPPPRAGRHAETRYAVDVPHTDVAGPWQAGQPLYHEEPPPPDAIPAAAELEP